MTRTEAQQIVGTLLAAFPYPEPPRSTVALYVAELELLHDPAIATQAVAELIRSPDSQWLPKIGPIRDAYQRIAHRQREARASTLGLPEGERQPIPDEAREQIERIIGTPTKEILRDV